MMEWIADRTLMFGTWGIVAIGLVPVVLPVIW